MLWLQIQSLVILAEDLLQTPARPEMQGTQKSNVDDAVVEDLKGAELHQGLSNAESCSTALEADSTESGSHPCYIAR